MNTLSVDLGGTNSRVAVVDAEGVVLSCEVHPTPQGDPAPTALVAQMRALSAGCDHAVVGVPGRVDHHRGTLDHAPNLNPAWAPSLSEAALADALGMRVSLANDADLAAVGEVWFGAGKGYHDVVYVTLSTGVGAGVLLNRKLVRGRRSIAEAGHTVIDEAAYARNMPSTFEQRASGTGLGRAAAWLGLSLRGAELMAAVDSDPRAARALEMTIASACVGIRNLAYVFSPELIVIGGGFGLVGERLWAPIRAHLAASGPPGMEIGVVGAALGDRAGLSGAAAWHRASS